MDECKALGGGGGSSDGGVVALTNGCLCCTLGGELETEVWRMLDTDQSREDQGMGVIKNKHSTDVESPPPPPRVF